MWSQHTSILAYIYICIYIYIYIHYLYRYVFLNQNRGTRKFKTYWCLELKYIRDNKCTHKSSTILHISCIQWHSYYFVQKTFTRKNGNYAKLCAHSKIKLFKFVFCFLYHILFHKFLTAIFDQHRYWINEINVEWC